MAITFPATTLADGALISKTFIDMVVDDINHLVDCPDAYHNATQSGQTATTSTFTQLTNPTVTVTPKRTGNLFVLGQLILSASAAALGGNVRLDINGAKGTAYAFNVAINTTGTTTCPVFGFFAVTANTAYTIKLEFNNFTGSGTITAVNAYPAFIYAREAGA